MPTLGLLSLQPLLWPQKHLSKPALLPARLGHEPKPIRPWATLLSTHHLVCRPTAWETSEGKARSKFCLPTLGQRTEAGRSQWEELALAEAHC